MPPEARESFLSLMERGGKALWNASGGTYKVALEARADEIRGQVEARYSGAPLPDPLLPDGGGF